MKFPKEENMTGDSPFRRSNEDHNRRKKKENGKRNMKDQTHGWTMRKKVKS